MRQTASSTLPSMERSPSLAPEKIMKVRAFLALVLAPPNVSAGIVEPGRGGRGYYGKDHERGVRCG
jgi:hypothetical protein